MPPSGFNADERTRERESGPVVIGGQTYHPARLTNKRLRDIRRMSRAAGTETKRMARESPEYEEALQEAREAGMEEKEAEAQAELAGMTNDAVVDRVQESLTEQLCVLLVTDGMQPPDPEVIRAHLEEDLDYRDVEGLMNYLMGGEDPTRTEAPTPS
jgi:hypothetical protein